MDSFLGERELLERPVVLVVDDTPENLWLVSSVLKKHYNVLVATNGVKAIEIAKSDPCPDLILLDIVMPEMDGYEVCLALKGMVETREIPIIFLTACSSAADEAHGMMVGAIDYIKKPIDPDFILSSVAKRLS
mgnify:CR=1 FL=1